MYRYTYSRRILIGLIFSCIGDGLLVWNELFLHGMFAFGIGHLFFISAFGFKPVKVFLGIPLYIASGLGIYFINIFIYITTKYYSTGLNMWLPQQALIYRICVPIYTILLVTMAWRAAARVRFFEVILFLPPSLYIWIDKSISRLLCITRFTLRISISFLPILNNRICGRGQSCAPVLEPYSSSSPTV